MNTRIAVLLATAVLTVACEKESETILSKVSINAVSEALTKVSLEDDLSCVWSSGDEIAVYDGTAVRKFAASSISGSSAVFTGEMNTSAGTFFSAYPYASASACSSGIWTTTIPSVQAIEPGYTIASGALVSVASFTDVSSVLFKQATGLVKVVLSESDILSVELRGNNGESLAGVVNVDASDGTVNSFQDAATSVTLIYADGAFPAGTYYIAVAPVTFSKGLTLSFTNTTGASAVFTSSNSAAVSRAGGIDLGDVTSGLSWDDSLSDNCVKVIYNGASAIVTVAANVSQYVTPTVSGAYVSIAQSNTGAVDNDEITYQLFGATTDGQFALSGSYKCTVSLGGVNLTCKTGPAINITNSKRIQLSAKKNTTNTLTDCAGGSQKACVYSKGQLQLQGNGTLNVVGNTKHAIKSGDYITVKNLTLNIKSAVGDGISCEEYFQMKSGTVTIGDVGDDGIQCELGGDSSTGETTDHEDEDSGNVYLEGGTINVSVTADAAKCIKSEGDMFISGTTIVATTSGGGLWDSSKQKTKSASCLSSDGNLSISGGALTLTSTGAGGKGINVDGNFTATGGNTTISTSGNAVVASSSGSLSVVTQSSQLDRYDSDYKSSPKGIKVDGAVTISGDAVISVTTTGAGGEGIESKTYVEITGGQTTIVAADDAINASYNDDTKGLSNAGDFTISGGYLYAQSKGNDGIDANGNCYVKGGVVYAIGASSPEVAIDANSEEKKMLYITGGTIIAVGGLESGASISGGTCKYTSSWTANSWYALYNGSELALAFKTPASSSSNGNQGGPGGGPGGNQGGGSQQLVVYTSSTPSLKSGVTVSGGTEYFGGIANIGGTVSGGSSVTLSSYSGNSGGGPGAR